jgi:Bacterial PH domain
MTTRKWNLLPDNQNIDQVVRLQLPIQYLLPTKKLSSETHHYLGLENIVSVSYDKITSIELERGVFSSKIIIRAHGFADVMEAISKKVADQIVEM